jgi:uncharacterized protein
MAHALSALVRDAHGAYRLMNVRNERVLADRVLPAFDSRSRRRGLLSHANLPRGSAMIVAPTNAIHTFFMRFSIDVAFIDRAGRVVKARPGVRPWRIVVAPRAFAVIELPDGTLSESQTTTGDYLVLRAAGG